MKITSDHLARGAFVYIRQSTTDQLANNHESRRRQYGLAERARALGWPDVTTIDDDLGRSGSGISRPGFERLLAAICEGRVGAVFAIEASRLARNGRDWHALIEFCGLDPCRYYSCRAILQRRALGDQTTEYRKSAAGRTDQNKPQRSTTSRSRSADLYLSMM
jgi:DNA invertase Pin-like site-specific DNA recombinase